MKVIYSGDKKIQKLALIISIIMLIICMIGLISYAVKVANFVEVPARIVDISIEYSNSTQNNQNRHKYVIYKYKLNNKEYRGERLTLFAPRSSIGNITDIRVNPNNPIEIQNNLIFTIYFIGIVISGATIALTYHNLKRK